MEPDLKSDIHEVRKSEELLQSLVSAFLSYTENETQKHQKKTRKLSRLFAGWFTGYNPLSANPDDQVFLDNVAHIIAQLVTVLEDMKPECSDRRMTIAAQAVKILLPPKPAIEKTASDWSLTVAEYQIINILPYLSVDDLKNTRAKLLERTPKRIMFPKQLELLQMIDKLLKA